MALVIERHGLKSSKCFVDTCLKQENDSSKIKLFVHLVEAPTNQQ